VLRPGVFTQPDAPSPRVSSADLSLPASANELLARLSKRSHNDRFVALVWYSLAQGAIDGITTDEILAIYSSARDKKPANPSDVVSTCIKRGLLIESKRENQKTWQITRTGEDYAAKLWAETQPIAS
jgi:hypothetical protein